MKISHSMLSGCALLLCISCVAFAQDPQGSITVDSKLNGDLIRLGGHAYDRHLADDIGPRLTGSANYVKAVEWAEGEFKQLGLVNVHREAWELPA